MAQKTGKIIIAKNIKLDKGHKDVLNYTEEQMVTLVRTNKVDEANNYSFIRDKGSISVNFDYEDCLKSNYMAFQNTDYANKWFFAFIDDVKFIAEGTTQIFYTIDSWATFFNDVNVVDSFVVREHTNDDTVGANTLPENFETGEFIINDVVDIDIRSANFFICMGVSEVPANTPVVTDDREYGGIYSGLTYFLFDDNEDCSKMIKALDSLGKADAIYSIFLIPTSLSFSNTFYTADLGDQHDIRFAIAKTSSTATSLVSDVSISSPSTINGYSPKNNKLKCYPYNYLYITNNAGGDITYNYEDFVNNTANINVDGVISTGCSIKLYPTNYKKYSNNNWKTSEFCFGLVGGKYPSCSWVSDAYTNWLTQNAVNIPLSIAGGVLSTATGVATGNAVGSASGVLSIANSIASIYQHSLVPDQAKGDINAGDIVASTGMIGFTAYKMSIKQEYARCIDEYFTKYGYKTNRNKHPNITGRRYWNYIQISADDILGYGEIPNRFMEEINNIARSGVTIWHDHANVGNYNLNNTIVNS